MKSLDLIADTVIAECGSTNDLARDLAEGGAPHGTWISARRQTAGRGRLGRSWESSEGNLFLSIVTRWDAPHEPSPSLSWIPLAVGVGAAECLREFNPRFTVQLKWPNDLRLDNAKLGGILCQGSSGSGESVVIVGIGLNCLHAPDGLDQETTSLSRVCRSRVTADEIRIPLLQSILAALESLRETGSREIARRYSEIALIRPGDEVEWTQGDRGFLGKVRGLGSQGELIVSTDSGESSLYADEVKIKV